MNGISIVVGMIAIVDIGHTELLLERMNLMRQDIVESKVKECVTVSPHFCEELRKTTYIFTRIRAGSLEIRDRGLAPSKSEISELGGAERWCVVVMDCMGPRVFRASQGEFPNLRLWEEAGLNTVTGRRPVVGPICKRIFNFSSYRRNNRITSLK